MRKKHFTALLIAIFVNLAFFSMEGFSKTAPNADEKELRAILDEFMRCIAEKDKAAFLELFTADSITWVGVTEPIFRTAILKRMPDHQGFRFSSHVKFIDWICSSESRIEEKFWNIEIAHDAAVAAVSFDFTFNENDVVTNWGKESWHLIKTRKGWKICSVIFTNTHTKYNPFKKAD